MRMAQRNLIGDKTSRRQFLGAAGVAVGTSVLSGCLGGSDDGAAQQNQSTDAGSQQNQSGNGDSSQQNQSFSAKVTVTHWPLLLYCPPYQVALKKGYYDKQGIDLSAIVGSSGGGTTVRNVVTGDLPFGEVSTPAAVLAHNAGSSLKIIASATNTVGAINWVAPKGSDIKEITDLKGKTLGCTSPGSVTQNTAALCVDQADGISVDDVTIKPMGGVSEGLTAVKEGIIAAAAHVEPIFSRQQLKEGPPEWQVVFWGRDYINAFQQTSIITGPDILENYPDVVKGYLQARAHGVNYLNGNLKEAAKIYASYNDAYNQEVMLSSIKNAKPKQYYTTGEFSIPGLKTVEKGMKNIDLIDQEINWSEIIDQSWLPAEKRVQLDKLK
jgi:NitT/TauT family transport system substrate-binding protein